MDDYLDEYDLDDYVDEEELDDEYDDVVDLGDAFRSALHPDYAALRPEVTDRALCDILESLDPAESFNLTSALSKIAGTAAPLAPVAGQALGTSFGGPIGGVAGKSLGDLASQSLAPRPKPAPAAPAASAARAAAPPVAAAPPAVSPGMPAPGAAATQALMLANSPLMQQLLLAAALADKGRAAVQRFQVPAALNAFGNLLQEAAAEADELFGGDEEWDGNPAQELYRTVMDADAACLD